MSQINVAPAASAKGRRPPLDAYFHYADRGGTFGGEIAAGLFTGILSVCGIFLNMQLIAKLQISGGYAASSAAQAAANGEIYAQLYFFSMLLSFLGSLIIGLAARLPLVQVSGLGLSTVVVSLAGTAGGLTYSNLLVVCFFSSIAYAILVSVPAVRQAVLAAVPAPVRKALPAAAGLLMAWAAMQLTGLISVNASAIPVYGAGTVFDDMSSNVMMPRLISFGNFSYAMDRYHPLILVSTLAVIFTFAVWLVLKRRSRRPGLYALLLGTVLFLVLNLCAVCINWKNFGMSLDSMWGRLWMVGSEDALHHHFSQILSSLSIGKIFSDGLDFSAYTANGGNVPLLFAAGLLTVLLTQLLDAQAVLTVVENHCGNGEEERKHAQRALMCNAGAGVIAPLIGAVPLSLGKESCAGAEDGGRSGLTSVAASAVLFISMFVWVVPFFFSTVMSYDIAFTMYGHYGETLQALTECSFAVADAVMVITGLSMVVKSTDIDWHDALQSVPLVVCGVGTLFLSNLAYGAALGTVSYLLLAMQSKETRPNYLNWCWGAVSIAVLVLGAAL